MYYQTNDYIIIVHYADQHESVHGLYQIQIRKVSLVNASEICEAKRYHQCTVGVCLYFSEVEFFYF